MDQSTKEEETGRRQEAETAKAGATEAKAPAGAPAAPRGKGGKHHDQDKGRQAQWSTAAKAAATAAAAAATTETTTAAAVSSGKSRKAPTQRPTTDQGRKQSNCPPDRAGDYQATIRNAVQEDCDFPEAKRRRQQSFHQQEGIGRCCPDQTDQQGNCGHRVRRTCTPGDIVGRGQKREQSHLSVSGACA